MRCQANRQVDNLFFVIWTSRVEGSGCRRFLSAVCGEYARKFVGGSDVSAGHSFVASGL